MAKVPGMYKHRQGGMPGMTPAQATALLRPCLLAEECAHPRYARHVATGSVVLTVNSGYE